MMNIAEVILQALFFILFFLTGLMIGGSRPTEFCCKAGKHWFAIDRPCPLCIGGMINEYKEAHKQ